MEHPSPPPPAVPPPPPPPPPKTYKLTASSISYAKPTTTTNILSPYVFFFSPCTSTPPTCILRDVSFTAHPSQILAVVGPSGAGKSTLLDILAARTSPTNGSLLLNSSPLNPSAYRKLSAHVPQHDACLPLLTVSETFAFAACLLLPKTAEIASTVASLLADLRLTHLAHTKLAHGISGGERRRVSIGLSLLHDPAVLLLDEPTSGLDSSSAFNVMQTLQSIAAARCRTVILSIHQPSFKILSTIDRILLLSKGRVVHHGTLSSLQAFLLSNGFNVPSQLNSLEYAMEILNQLPEIDISKKLPITPPSPPPAIRESNTAIRERREIIKYRSSRAHEIVALYGRFWKIIYRTKQLLLTNTLEALIVGLVLGTIYINIGFDKQGIEKRLGLFAFTLTFLLSSTTETLPIFINERPILLRETSSGIYRLSSYLVANTLVFIPYLLAIAILYSVSVYFLVGLCCSWQAFGYFVLVIWVIVLMANSFVLFLSSLAPNYISGTSLTTVLLAGFFLFSGYFISEESLPKYWLFMHYLSMYKYALDALLINEYSCLVSRCLIWFEENKTCMVTGRDVLEKRGLREGNRWTNVYVLIGFFVLYRVLCLLVLIRRISRSKK
ncbi:ABC transporter G family member 8-like [Malania oleifera]|uniref:ABC transporter G family member 8-like n=1 Tax=Malania oleifera TaxID=397392 RepID=UPI0025AE6615|nr:ABC transporter G family member 8-like [Malania oleifera]XP_057950624.1 ABC transporter G family member 8-like [Malania oleifera]XP_057950625.1 ABC transporter G family member 8-like [Malania oleifera]XP_057950626.1 ABC transporter G family member 8-like [Malania oleifera]XP_057950627.1 ABC transporter G family member 8-like [Malania oleifera]XP_057950628.1 ABC transporter G family member 8-like [Malania oleifera]